MHLQIQNDIKYSLPNYMKLEIWGKVQRESTRHCKSNWWKKFKKGGIPLEVKLRGPNSNALAYAEHALSI